MKKQILMLTAAAVIGFSSGGFVFAEEVQGMGYESQQGQGQGMMGGQRQGQGNGPMMGMMQKETMLATSDGGVVILAGPRLIKYDKNLTLVKEVEMPRPKKPGQGGEKGQPSGNEMPQEEQTRSQGTY